MYVTWPFGFALLNTVVRDIKKKKKKKKRDKIIATAKGK